MNRKSPQYPNARTDVAFRQVGDEWVLYDPTNNSMHVLNLVASLVWVHCDGTVTNEKIAEAIQENFPDVSIETLSADVGGAVGSFQSEGLLVP